MASASAAVRSMRTNGSIMGMFDFRDPQAPAR